MTKRLCYISRNYRGIGSAGNKAKTDNEDTLVDMGATNLGLARTYHNNKITAFIRDLTGIIHFACSVRPNDHILLQYPIKKYFSLICRIARWRGASTAALIHDLGSFRRHKLSIPQEIARLSHATRVIASNKEMEQWLRDNGYKGELDSLGLFDYLSPSAVATEPDFWTCTEEGQPAEQLPQLVYAGALAMRKNAFFLQWILIFTATDCISTASGRVCLG